MALLYLLLETKHHLPFELGLAHVDHRWRENSSKEAAQLQYLAEELKLPFYLKVLSPESAKGNLENACREQRLSFFRQICDKEGYEAVVLAHHAGDLAETVLKRCFECSSLFSLGGMEAVKHFENLIIIRPLLKISKKELLAFLKSKQISFFEDPSNQDPTFLRAKMRIAMLPTLEKTFGKNVQPSLCRLSEDILELNGYFREKLSPLIEKRVKSSLGLCVDFRNIHASFEIKWLLHELFQNEKIPLNYALLQVMVDHLMARGSNKTIVEGALKVTLDRGYLFILQNKEKPLVDDCSLTVGDFKCGDWFVKVENASFEAPSLLGWKQVWLGKCRAIIPKGPCRIGPALAEHKRALSRLWTNEKVPSFLRCEAPIIYNGDHFLLDFLSGKLLLKKTDRDQGALMVSLYRE